MLPTGFYGVPTGMNYKLFVSVQRHDTNPDAVTLVGKTITVVDGPGAGQTATITGYDSTNQTYTLDRKWTTAVGPGSKFEIQQSTATLAGYAPVTDSYQVVLTSSAGSTVIVNVSPQDTPTYNSADAFDPSANYGQNSIVQARVATSRATFLLTGRPADGETWTILLNDRAFSFGVSASTSLSTIAQNLATAIRAAGYNVVVSGAQLIVTTSAPVGGVAPAFYAGFRIDHDVAGGALVTPITSSASKITLSGSPAAGEKWTLNVGSVNFTTAALTASDTLSSVANMLAALLRAATGITYSVSVLGASLTVTRTDIAGAPVGPATLTVSAPTIGTIVTNTYFDYATFDFSGTPFENEQWSIRVDSDTYSYTSHAGDSLNTVMQGIVNSIFSTGANLSVGFGGSQLWVFEPWWFFWFNEISASANVSPGPPTTYGSMTKTDSTSLGVSVALTGIPQAGQTWTLTLDGQPYAFTVSGTMTLPQVAQQLAARLPGATYAITVASNVITVYRTSTQAVTASITVSSLGTASSSTSGNTATVEFTGVPVEAELWTVTVDGILFVQLSHSTDTLTTVLSGLAASIAGTMPGYTATVDLSGGRFRLRITHTGATSIVASTSVMLDTVETQGGAAVSGSGANASVDLAGAIPGPNESWTLTVDGVAYTHIVAAGGETAAQVAAALRLLVPSGTYAVCGVGPNPACARPR